MHREDESNSMLVVSTIKVLFSAARAARQGQGQYELHSQNSYMYKSEIKVKAASFV